MAGVKCYWSVLIYPGGGSIVVVVVVEHPGGVVVVEQSETRPRPSAVNSPAGIHAFPTGVQFSCVL